VNYAANAAAEAGPSSQCPVSGGERNFRFGDYLWLSLDVSVKKVFQQIPDRRQYGAGQVFAVDIDPQHLCQDVRHCLALKQPLGPRRFDTVLPLLVEVLSGLSAIRKLRIPSVLTSELRVIRSESPDVSYFDCRNRRAVIVNVSLSSSERHNVKK
jgi:hypothetical protein